MCTTKQTLSKRPVPQLPQARLRSNASPCHFVGSASLVFCCLLHPVHPSSFGEVMGGAGGWVSAEPVLSAAPWVAHGCSPLGVSLPQRGSHTVEVLEISKLLIPVLEPSGIGSDWPGAVHALLPHWAPLLPLLTPVQAQYTLLNFNRNCQLFHRLFFFFTAIWENFRKTN